MESHERMNDRIRVSFGFLASLGAQGESLAEDHSLDGALHVDGAARHAIPAKLHVNIEFAVLRAKLGGKQVAADEDALQELDEEKHEGIEETLAELK